MWKKRTGKSSVNLISYSFVDEIKIEFLFDLIGGMVKKTVVVNIITLTKRIARSEVSPSGTTYYQLQKGTFFYIYSFLGLKQNFIEKYTYFVKEQSKISEDPLNTLSLFEKLFSISLILKNFASRASEMHEILHLKAFYH